MTIDTYDQLVEHLQSIAANSVNDTIPCSLILCDKQTGAEALILPVSPKQQPIQKISNYNKAYIIYSPPAQYRNLQQTRYPKHFSYDKRTEQSLYYCTTIAEAREIGEFLINNTQAWSISIDKEDVLEVL